MEHSLAEEWRNVETKERLISCTMLITEPNRLVADVDDRMPVILGRGSFKHGSTAQWASMISRRRSRMTNLHRRRVGRRVNKLRRSQP